MQQIITELHCEHGLRIVDIAKQLRISPVEVSNWLEFGQPEDPTPLPSVGPPNDKLYRQGTCAGCQIPLFGGDPKPREWCGECDPRARLL